MKNVVTFLTLFLFAGISVFAQVGIKSDNTPPDPSAMLDVQSSNKGMLIPRMTSVLRSAISSPVNGLMVYQTDDVSGVYYYNGTLWQRIGETDGSETKVTAGSNVTVTGNGTIASPYVINASGGGSSGHYVGELFGGGIVFWVDNTGQHGLIASLVDISTGAAWSNITNGLIGPSAQSTGNGKGNSTAIMGQNGHTASAAKLCDNYTNANYSTGIYSDWYLPAIDQLSLIYHARYILNKNIEGISGANIFAGDFYWSSSEYIADYAWIQLFSFGYHDYSSKSNYFYVRAVRDF